MACWYFRLLLKRKWPSPSGAKLPGMMRRPQIRGDSIYTRKFNLQAKHWKIPAITAPILQATAMGSTVRQNHHHQAWVPTRRSSRRTSKGIFLPSGHGGVRSRSHPNVGSPCYRGSGDLERDWPTYGNVGRVFGAVTRDRGERGFHTGGDAQGISHLRNTRLAIHICIAT